MRKLILAATGLVCLTGISYFIGSAAGQQAKTADDTPHRVALIDVGYIFERYEKVKALQEDYKKDEADAEAQAKDRVAKIQKKQLEMKQYKEDAPEYAPHEQKYAQLISEFETFKKITQKDLVKKQGKMFHTAYLDVQDTVEKVCKKYGYTMAMRFSRDEPNGSDPQKLMAGLNRPVLYHREQDDISEMVLNYLNSRYSASGGQQPAAAAPAARKAPGAVKPVEGRAAPKRTAAAEKDAE